MALYLWLKLLIYCENNNDLMNEKYLEDIKNNYRGMFKEKKND